MLAKVFGYIFEGKFLAALYLMLDTQLYTLIWLVQVANFVNEKALRPAWLQTRLAVVIGLRDYYYPFLNALLDVENFNFKVTMYWD